MRSKLEALSERIGNPRSEEIGWSLEFSYYTYGWGSKYWFHTEMVFSTTTTRKIFNFGFKKPLHFSVKNFPLYLWSYSFNIIHEKFVSKSDSLLNINSIKFMCHRISQNQIRVWNFEIKKQNNENPELSIFSLP
jgi:hypothetical protein